MLYPKKSPARILQEKNEKRKLADKQREVLNHLISSSVLDSNSLVSSLVKLPLSSSQIVKSSSAVVSPNSIKPIDIALNNNSPVGNINFANQPQSLAVSLVVNDSTKGKNVEYGNQEELGPPKSLEGNNEAVHRSETLSELENYLSYLEQQESKPEKELDFLSEKDEWLALQKYLAFLKDQEDKKKKNRKESEISKLGKDIAEQIDFKRLKKKERIEEEKSYLRQIKAQFEEYKKKISSDEIEKKMKLKLEKELVKKQIEEKKARNKLQMIAEKAYDSKFIEKNKEELDQMAEEKLQRKAFLKDYKDDLYKQRIKEGSKKMEINEIEKKESLEMIRANMKKMEEQEREYLQEAQNRLLKFQEFQVENDLLFEKNRLQQEKAHQLLLEQRVKRREDLKLKTEEEAKRRIAEKHVRDKLELSNVLESQLLLEKDRKKNEKVKNNDQALMWKMEREDFERKDRENKERKLELYKKNQEDLLQQIREKEEKKKNTQHKMTDEEAKINSHLIEEMKAMRNRKLTSLQGIFN